MIAVRSSAPPTAARARILEVCTYPPPRAGWSMRVELLKKQLEALALRVPTVAAENGTRPAGVVTFRGQDPVDLSSRLQYVINERHSVVARIPSPEIHDTLREEIAVLTGAEAATV
jgi:hypothetical protein